MFCARCGKEITAERKFCTRCGAPNPNYQGTAQTLKGGSKQIPQQPAQQTKTTQSPLQQTQQSKPAQTSLQPAQQPKPSQSLLQPAQQSRPSQTSLHPAAAENSYPLRPADTARQHPPKKYNTRIITAIVCGAVALLLVIGTTLFLLLREKPNETVLDALRDGDYSAADELLDRNSGLKSDSEIQKLLYDRIDEIEDDYEGGKLSGKQAVGELKQIVELNVPGVSRLADTLLELFEDSDPNDVGSKG